MRLSIITINLNNANGLRKTIESVINQTFTDYEYIIIDGGSTDGSVDVIREFAEKITFWVSEPDKGIYNAMNKGIIKAKGEYYLFLNSGDFFHNKKVLATVIPKLIDSDVVYGNIIFLPPDFYNNANQQLELERNIKPYPGRKRPLKIYLRIGSTIPHQAAFFKRTVFEKIGYYNESYKIASDLELNIRILKYGKFVIEYIPDIISYFVLDGIGSDFSKDSLVDKEVRIIREKYFKQTYYFLYKIAYFLDKKKAKLINYLEKHILKS